MPSRILYALSALAALALVAPAAAAADASADRGGGSAGSAALSGPPSPAVDGMLTVRSANGILMLSGRGTVLGQVVGKARVLIEDPDPTDGVPVVSGYDRAQRQGKSGVLYIGSDLRFRILAGSFRLRIVSAGISLSFVGRGTASLVPAGTLDDGAYSFDGGETYRPLGFGATTTLVIGATPAVQPSGLAIGIVRDFP